MSDMMRDRHSPYRKHHKKAVQKQMDAPVQIRLLAGRFRRDSEQTGEQVIRRCRRLPDLTSYKEFFTV